MRSVLLILAVAAAFASPVAAQDSTVPTETLIDQLTQLDAEAPAAERLGEPPVDQTLDPLPGPLSKPGVRSSWLRRFHDSSAWLECDISD